MHDAAILAAMLDASDDAIILTTLDGTVTSWNPAAERVFGYSAEEMLGGSVLRLVPPDRLADVRRLLARVEAGERFEHFETERLRKDGARIHVSVTVDRDRALRAGFDHYVPKPIEPRRLVDVVARLARTTAG